MQVGGYYAVEPKRDCPHIEEIEIHSSLESASVDYSKNLFSSSCINCDESNENWICLICNSLFCSRYKNSHMVDHNTETGHSLAISLSDLSKWCYQCEAYIVSPKLHQVHSLLYLAKFDKLPPNFSKDPNPIDINSISKSNSKSVYPSPNPIHFELPDDINNNDAKGHVKKESIQEYKDDEAVLDAKIDELYLLLKASHKIVTFTGAGISTSAKIPDYRGPNGVWTMRDRGLAPKGNFVDIKDAEPTLTHKALKSLCDLPDKDHFIVSTNIDGLHYKSGVPLSNLAELHGNIFKQKCCLCGKVEYITPDKLSKKLDSIPKEIETNENVDKQRLSHALDRKCECGGLFCDSIINFGETLEQNEIQKAFKKGSESNLSLVLGTSMGVAPANKLPSLALQNDGKLVIINLQNTPYDDLCAVRIWATTDAVFEKLLPKLNIEI